MREFVARHVRNAPAEGSRLRRLLKGMIDEGYLDLVYDTDLTHNARTTFEQRNGNCLSFTLLFVALAREANLDARFQIVDIPPVWESEGQWVILDKHINVVLPDIQAEANFTRDYVVDFNVDDYRGNYDRRQVDDEHAFALYYSNLGVEALQSGQVDDAQALFEKSLTLNDRIPATWVNIGALRATTGDFDAALNAYQTALEVNPGDRSALVNMAGMLSELGREEEAARYERRVRYYRNRNPYFHYSLSLVAYEQGNWDDALKKINRALHLKREEHQFHLLKALIGYRMDNVAMAERSLTRAMNLAEQTSIKQRYARKLQALATVSSR
jgi:Flp pilus assembly protein TadD